MLEPQQATSEAVTDKIVRFARGSARRARELDGKAPRRSATIGGAQFLSVRINSKESAVALPDGRASAIYGWACRAGPSSPLPGAETLSVSASFIGRTRGL